MKNTEINPADALLDDYRWLVGDAGREWLGRVGESGQSVLAATKSLRRELSEGRVHLLLEQLDLRRRARVKFAAAERMFFTRTGLEQASDQVLAAYKARRFPQDAACFDLCCGIGGDLLGLAGRCSGSKGAVVGVERDRIAALLAAANIRECECGAGLSGSALNTAGQAGSGTPVHGQAAGLCGSGTPAHGQAAVIVADVDGLQLPPDAVWHLDPDRRATGRRATRLELHSPGLAAVELLIDCAANGCIKLAPAAEVPADWAERGELEWIGRRRQCRQLVVWLGSLAASPGLRRATVLQAAALADEPAVHTIAGRPRRPLAVAQNVGRYVFEPDAAVLAAHLTGELAARHGLLRLAPGSVYLSGDTLADDPLLACYHVEESLPFDRKRVKKLLAARGIERLEIKHRGLELDPERLRRELRMGGASEGDPVLIVCKRGEGSLAVLCQTAPLH